MTPPGETTTYARQLGLFSATMVVMGGIIGSGIFLSPAIVAQRVGTTPLTLAAWTAGGVIALLGGLVYAELGARRPEAGGNYLYIRDALGGLPGFLFAWTFLGVINAGGIAAVAITFSTYLTAGFGMSPDLLTGLAVAAIVVLTAINVLGVGPGAVTLNVFTVLKLGALAVLIVAGLAWAGGPADSLPAPTAQRGVRCAATYAVGSSNSWIFASVRIDPAGGVRLSGNSELVTPNPSPTPSSALPPGRAAMPAGL